MIAAVPAVATTVLLTMWTPPEMLVSWTTTVIPSTIALSVGVFPAVAAVWQFVSKQAQARHPDRRGMRLRRAARDGVARARLPRAPSRGDRADCECHLGDGGRRCAHRGRRIQRRRWAERRDTRRSPGAACSLVAVAKGRAAGEFGRSGARSTRGYGGTRGGKSRMRRTGTCDVSHPPSSRPACPLLRGKRGLLEPDPYRLCQPSRADAGATVADFAFARPYVDPWSRLGS